MPRLMSAKRTPSYLKDEVVFTRSALQAYPETLDLLPLTESWLPAVEDAAKRADDIRQQESVVLAQRLVADASLAEEVKAFSSTLLAAVRGDRSSSRYLTFFKLPPSEVVHLPQADIVRKVKGWLADYDDEALEQHREALTCWVSKLESALAAEETLRSCRVKRDDAYVELCTQLSVERDDLFSSLRQLAKANSRRLTWAQLFFLRG